MSLDRFAIGVVVVSVSLPSLAQTTGSLSYGPATLAPVVQATTPTPVPIPSFFLFPLAIALAFFGYRALRKQGGRQFLGAVLLAAGMSLGVSTSLHVKDAIAAVMIELNQPEGGTVEIPASDAIYTNTSGVALQIGSVAPPLSCITSEPTDECVTDLRLENGESCSTVYECTPTLSVNDVTVDEGAVASFEVTKNGQTASPVTVQVDTADGTAIALTAGAGDYDAKSGTLTFNPSSTAMQTLNFSVQTNQDSLSESDETFTVTLSGATNATIDDPIGTGIIIDDEVVGNPPTADPVRTQADLLAGPGPSGTPTNPIESKAFTVNGIVDGLEPTLAPEDPATLGGSDSESPLADLSFTIRSLPVSGKLYIDVEGTGSYQEAVLDESFTSNSELYWSKTEITGAEAIFNYSVRDSDGNDSNEAVVILEQNASPEVCDGVDNDFNGVADDGLSCSPATCTDGILNGTETGIDCGGLCDSCSVNESCQVDSDCSSNQCVLGECI